MEPRERLLAADEVLLEIRAIERYGSLRLVKYRLSYNDQELTTRSRAWLATPRGLYDCARACVSRIEDLGWLLRHLQQDVPLYQFPLRPGRAWGQAGAPAEPEQAPVRVRPEPQDVEVPAGTFIGAQVVEIRRGGLFSDPFMRVERGVRVFARGEGVVRRELEGVSEAGEEFTLIEELVKSRVMP